MATSETEGITLCPVILHGLLPLLTQIAQSFSNPAKALLFFLRTDGGGAALLTRYITRHHGPAVRKREYNFPGPGLPFPFPGQMRAGGMGRSAARPHTTRLPGRHRHAGILRTWRAAGHHCAPGKRTSFLP